MDEPGRDGVAFDLASYERRSRGGPCFVCALLSGNPDYAHDIVYQDAASVAFLNRYPTLRGSCLVAPKRHVESWVDDLTENEHAEMQRVVHRVARAVRAVVPTERMYCLSLGSRQGNAHLHWHVSPLPPGVPYHRQQYRALMMENGIVDVNDLDQAALARAIAGKLSSARTDPGETPPAPPR